MRWYDRHILPPLLNCVCGLKPMQKQREKIVPQAKGRVLEIGVGSGLNLPFYNPHQVTSLFAIDPYYKLNQAAKCMIKESSFPITINRNSADQISLPDNSIDTVIVTYTLCSLPNPDAALKELRRVLVPSGQLYFVEHGLAPDMHIAQWQNRLNRFWKFIAGGCNLNLDIANLLLTNQWHISIEQMYLPQTPKIVGYNYWGSAPPILPIHGS